MNLLPPPGPARNRQFVLLVLLAGALGFMYWFNFGRTTATGAAPSSKVTGRTDITPADKAKIPLVDTVKLTALDAAPEASQPGRNPFRFGAPPAPPAPPQPPPPLPQPPPVYVPPAPQGPPPINLEYNGYIEAVGSKNRLASVTDPASGTSFLVVEGSGIDGQYIVVRLAADSMTVSYRDGTGMRTISRK